MIDITKYNIRLTNLEDELLELNNEMKPINELLNDYGDLIDSEDHIELKLRLNKIENEFEEKRENVGRYNILIQKLNMLNGEEPNRDEEEEEEIINEAEEETGEESGDEETEEETKSETPSEELKKPTEFKNMDEVFKNYINSTYIATNNKNDKIKPREIKEDFNKYIEENKLINNKITTFKVNELMEYLGFQRDKSNVEIYRYIKKLP